MVRLHVMDHEVIRLAAFKGLGQVGLPLLALAGVGSVHHGHLIIQDDVGIVGHPFGDDILAFEKVEVEVVDSDILDFGIEVYGHVLCV